VLTQRIYGSSAASQVGETKSIKYAIKVRGKTNVLACYRKLKCVWRALTWLPCRVAGDTWRRARESALY
jgi:hypothetical protein